MNEQNLRRVLWTDAIGSATSVVFTITGAGLIGRWLDVSPWIPVTVGVVLIPWVVLLVRIVKHAPLRPAEVGVIAAGNLAWAVGAAVLIFGYPDALSTGGKWIVGLFSLAVLDLGLLQLIGFKTLTKRRQPAPVEAALQRGLH